MDEHFTFVPHHMRDGFKRWIEEGLYPGSFGTAIINNDLTTACGKADHVNAQHITSIVAWFYNHAPSDCWGSHEKVLAWYKLKGETS